MVCLLLAYKVNTQESVLVEEVFVCFLRHKSFALSLSLPFLIFQIKLFLIYQTSWKVFGTPLTTKDKAQVYIENQMNGRGVCCTWLIENSSTHHHLYDLHEEDSLSSSVLTPFHGKVGLHKKPTSAL